MYAGGDEARWLFTSRSHRRPPERTRQRWRATTRFPSKRAGKRPAVDQDVLAGDEAGPRAGEKGAERAEFGRIAEAAGGIARLRLGARRLERYPALGGGALQRGPLIRSVSNAPGWIELIVTLSRTCARAAEARNAVRPARAPDETSSPAIGARTEPEVMLTMRPNLRSAIPGSKRLNERDRRQHVGFHAA